MYRFIKKYKYHYLLGLLLIVVSVVFRNDTSKDAIVETTLSAVLHDGSFAISPFTGQLIENGHFGTPMTYIYWVLSITFRVHPAIIIKWVVPVLVMLFFITINGALFEEIFGKDSKLAALSLWFLLVSTLTFCFITSIDFTGLWESPWTDKSVVLYCLVPLVITIIVWIFKKIAKIRSEICRIGKKGSIVLLAVWGALIFVSGINGGVFLNSTFSLPDNRFKIDKEIMNVREMVESMPEVIMLAPTEVALQIQDCDEKVKLIDAPDKMADSDIWDGTFLGQNGANVVVLDKSDISDQQSIVAKFYDRGYEKLGETDQYEIYQFVSEDLGKYTVTQYASVTGNQSMIYTITDWEGHLVIIDGGWKEDTDQLLNIIKDYGGKVDAWIITHPHPDHVGGFNGVYASGVVPIDVIYTIPMDYDMYKDKARYWDEFEVYEEYLQLTAGAENIIYLNEGDALSLLGLNMEVFHSFDIKEMEGKRDPCNSGGLIFKLSGRKNKMLFLADVGSFLSETFLARYKDQLKCDYVQMGHHGNGGMTEDVYKVIAPTVAFFDAPESLVNNMESNASTKRLYMEGIGAQVYDYTTAPNVVIIE